MSRPRSQSRSSGAQKPRPAGPRPTSWRAALPRRPTLPGPGRLAGLGALVAIVVAALVMLVSVSAGGLNRFGLQRLAADAPAPVPTSSRYINR